jgi:type IV secretory pathway VirB2 component (pilin)
VVHHGASVLVGAEGTGVDKGDFAKNVVVLFVTFAPLKFHTEMLGAHEGLGNIVEVVLGRVGTVVVVVGVVEILVNLGRAELN